MHKHASLFNLLCLRANLTNDFLKVKCGSGHVHKYEAVFGSFVDIEIVVTFLSFA